MSAIWLGSSYSPQIRSQGVAEGDARTLEKVTPSAFLLKDGETRSRLVQRQAVRILRRSNRPPVIIDHFQVTDLFTYQLAVCAAVST